MHVCLMPISFIGMTDCVGETEAGRRLHCRAVADMVSGKLDDVDHGLMVGGDSEGGFKVTDEKNEGDEENDGEDAFDAFGFHRDLGGLNQANREMGFITFVVVANGDAPIVAENGGVVVG